MATGHCGQVPEPHYIRMVVYRFNFFFLQHIKRNTLPASQMGSTFFSLVIIYVYSQRTYLFMYIRYSLRYHLDFEWAHLDRHKRECCCVYIITRFDKRI